VARGLSPSTVRVREVASRPVVACRDSDTVQSAMDLMAANHIRRLAVQSETGRIVGWLTLGDLSRKLLVDSTPLQESLSRMTGEASSVSAEQT
jgi:CBS domain-containing protein